MGLHIFPIKILNLVNIIISILCPAAETYNLLFQKKEKPNEDYVHHIHFITYWIIYSLYCCLESILLIHIMNYIPFYYELKLLLFFWLYNDTFQGAGYIYFKFIEKHYGTIDKKVCDAVYTNVPKNIINLFPFEKMVQQVPMKKSASKLRNMVSK
ncbi:HVA22-like protein, putative [Plasmodium vinckei vinckei]|uniref:HVA22-like protein, putative n=1 Tax=Plasmodium vinckei vinckei TaxID=54757 RepID=A0A449BVG1_PLAVN|nr:HVA22-like protein, putative [Plasmodium vinckei vinckei]KEG02528.1 hypothetical protein YYE_02356 [Plasmodium vinckei vinckei]VEV57476.1 HVA22-like protein, putative [Plasmodium vinckei vinckei]